MRKANVYRNGQLIGILTRLNKKSYEFSYNEAWFANRELPAVSLTMPKTMRTYKSDHLFPMFFNMLSEGVNRRLQIRQLKIDDKDYFGLLLATAKKDTIGPITLLEIEE